MKSRSVKPKMIRTDNHFFGSVFQNCAAEEVLTNIIKLQKSLNPEAWTPFSWRDYKHFCEHNALNFHAWHESVLNNFFEGGKSVSETLAYLSGGWLFFDGKCYSLPEKITQMLGRDYKIKPKNLKTK